MAYSTARAVAGRTGRAPNKATLAVQSIIPASCSKLTKVVCVMTPPPKNLKQ